MQCLPELLPTPWPPARSGRYGKTVLDWPDAPPAARKPGPGLKMRRYHRNSWAHIYATSIPFSTTMDYRECRTVTLETAAFIFVLIFRSNTTAQCCVSLCSTRLGWWLGTAVRYPGSTATVGHAASYCR